MIKEINKDRSRRLYIKNGLIEMNDALIDRVSSTIFVSTN